MKNDAWDRHSIREAVWRRGSTLAQLAKSNGLEPSSTRVALHRPNKAGEAAIADFLGVPVDELFRYRNAPSQATPTTQPLRRHSRKSAAISTGAGGR